MNATIIRPELKPLIVGLCAAMALGAAGCAEKTGASSSGGTPAAADAGLPIDSPDVFHPKLWTDFTLDANSAKSHVDSVGHYHTDKNMCQSQGDGVYQLAAWNQLAAALDQAATVKLLPTPRCWDSPNDSKFYNTGVAELTISEPGATPTSTAITSKRRLFEYKNGQICSPIADEALASSLMSQIETAIRLADCAGAQDCAMPAETIAARCGGGS